MQYVISGSWDWDGKDSIKGLFLYEYKDDGSLVLLDLILPEVKVGSTPVQGNNNLFYIVEERCILEGRKAGGGGYIYTIFLNQELNKFEVVCRNQSSAATPSFCDLSTDGKYLAVSHHTSSRNSATKLVKDENGKIQQIIEHDDAALVLFEVDKQGMIKEAVDFDVYTDELPNRSLLHSVRFMKDCNLLIAGDKGLSRVHAWKIDNNQLQRVNSIFTKENSACRYSAMNEKHQLFYINNEQQPLLYTFAYSNHGIELIHTSKVIEDDQKAMASDLVISQDGKYLYNILRIANKVAIYDLDENGIPYFRHTVDGHGDHNRGCVISKDGKYLMACSMESDCIAVFSILNNGERKCESCFN